jgi:hypothetical protein
MTSTCFLSLPWEIRQQIYTRALSSSTGYIVPLTKGNKKALSVIETEFEPAQFQPPNSTWLGTIPLALLQTCKTVHAEAKGIVYQRNTFAIVNIETVGWELINLHSRKCHQVQTIWIRVDLQSRKSLEQIENVLKIYLNG